MCAFEGRFRIGLKTTELNLIYLSVYAANTKVKELLVPYRFTGGDFRFTLRPSALTGQ
jgi:hypothetical protein